MKKNKTYRIALLGVGVLVFVLLLVVIQKTGTQKETDSIKVGFILTGDVEEKGWNGMHYQGISKACEELDAELLVKENVLEFTGQCTEAVHELAEEGAEVIILSSYGYSEEVQDTVKEYPEIDFYCNSSEYHDTNMTSYFVRMYQARYLAGIVAGLQTESNRIGYVAAMANNEVNRGISAFTLGVRKVNPEAEVVVAWTGAWDDEAKEKAAAYALIDEEQADILTYHQNRSHVIDVAEEAGIASIGYHEAMSGYSPDYLTSAVCNWKIVYRQIIEEFLKGKGNNIENYWIGLEEGAIGLAEYSEVITEQAKEAVEKAKEDILGGNDVFSGVIYDREGNQRCGENEVISDEVLLEQFDWYVEGVEFYGE